MFRLHHPHQPSRAQGARPGRSLEPNRSALAPLAAAALAFAAAAVAPPAARACSICGCDPSVGSLGVDRPARSSLRLGLESRYLQKESGTGDAAEGEKEGRLQLRAQWAPTAPLVLQLELPFYLFKNHYDGAGAQDFATSGLGDAQLSARWEFLRLGGVRPAHVLALTGTLKLPTGANDLAIAGMDPDEHLQRGSGTWDGLAGLHFATTPFEAPLTLFASASGRLNGTNSRGFRYGNALFGGLGGRYAFLADQTLQLSLEAQVRAAGKDRAQDGSHDPDSGGTLGYATAGLAWSFLPDLFVRGTVQLPVVSALNGTQTEHPVAYLGLAYDLAL
jgi:hypothetical protein